jgi:hypothetical protein
VKIASFGVEGGQANQMRDEETRMDGRSWAGQVRIGALSASLVGVLMAACAAPDAPGDQPTAGETVERPETRRLTVEIEGLAEDMRVALYRSPPGFPLPFSTYVPEEMITEAGSTGEGDGVHFVANFGGHRNDAAAVRLVVAPDGAAEEDVVRMLRNMATRLGTELSEEPERRFSWSLREFRNVAPAAQLAAAEGLMAIGRRDGRIFVLALHHPAEYGDGFGPRAGVILDEWRWDDTGEPLGRGF